MMHARAWRDPRRRVSCARPRAFPAVTDGPFPETKEFLAGFWIVECASAERAYAARLSAAPD